MKGIIGRKNFAVVLLFALILPILAACGGGGGGAPAATQAPADDSAATAAPAAEATEAPAADATEAPAEATEAPAADTGGGAANAKAGVLRVNIGGEPATVDPQKASFVDQIQFIMMNYQPLMTFDLDMKPIPGAAESFEVSEDGTVYTFKIPEGSQYSDGTPLTAANFEYAWTRLADPETQGEYQSLPCGIIKGYSDFSAAACQGKTLTETLELDLESLRAGFGVKAIDDTTLEITLEAPAPYFPAMAALWIGAPTRQEDVEKGEDWWYDPENYIGNGPFTLVEWEHETRAVWEANPNWRLGPIKLTGLEYYMINDSQVAFQAYQNGELDILPVAPEDLEAVNGDPTLSAEANPLPGSCTFYFGFNLNKAPFDNPQVRAAFAQAFDREAWNRDIFNGLGNPTQSFIPVGFPGYQELPDIYPFNAEAAKQTLADAGFADGAGLPEIKLTYSASARNNTRFEWVANQLKQNLGIDAVLDPVDSTAYSALFQDPTTVPQFFSLGWCADYPDPQNWISLFRTGGVLNDRVGYTNPEFDELTQQADVEQDETKRFEMYAEAEKMLLMDAPIIVTRNNGGLELIKPYVKGVTEETVTAIDYWPGFFNLKEVSVEP